MVVEKRLQQIEKPARDVLQKAQTKQRLMEKQRTTFTRELWLRRGLLVAIAAIALFFVLTSSAPLAPHQAHTPFTVDSDIERLDVIYNNEPDRSPNIAYPIYLERTTLQGSVMFLTLQSILLEAQQNATPYDEKIDNSYAAYEYLMTYANGEQRQIKYVVYANSDVLYDVTAKMRYELSPEQDDIFYEMRVLASGESKVSTNVLLTIYGVFIATALLYQFVLEKRYLLVSKKEAKALRKGSQVLHIVVWLLIFVPVIFLKFFLGATNILLVLLGIAAASLLVEYTEVKSGIKRPSIVPILFTLLQLVVILTIFVI